MFEGSRVVTRPMENPPQTRNEKESCVDSEGDSGLGHDRNSLDQQGARNGVSYRTSTNKGSVKKLRPEVVFRA